MDILSILLLGLFLSVIIYFAVRLAILTLIPKEKKNSETDGMSLMRLKDIGIFSENEIKEVITVFNHSKDTKNQQEFEVYKNILNDLKEIGYLDSKRFESKFEKLKSFYNINN